MAATERIPLLVTRAQKMLFIRKAKTAKLTVNEFVRRAAEAYDPSDEDEGLLRLIDEVEKSTRAAMAAVDESVKFCAESNARIEALEAAHVARKRQ